MDLCCGNPAPNDVRFIHMHINEAAKKNPPAVCNRHPDDGAKTCWIANGSARSRAMFSDRLLLDAAAPVHQTLSSARVKRRSVDISMPRCIKHHRTTSHMTYCWPISQRFTLAVRIKFRSVSIKNQLQQSAMGNQLQQSTMGNQQSTAEGRSRSNG